MTNVWLARVWAGVSAGLVAMSLAVLGQQSRDTTTPPPSSGATVSGRLVTIEASPRPVRRALVNLSEQGLPTTRTVGTDDEGLFSFAGLPAGTVTLSASKPGYVATFYGSRGPGRGPSVPIVLAAGEQRTNLVMTIAHGAAITGTIVDQNGRPQPMVRVQAQQFRVINGERTLSSVAAAQGVNVNTDDRGFYRLWGLPPGSFVVSVSPNNLPLLMPTRLITDADLQWAAQQMQQPADAAAYGRSTGPTSRAPDAGGMVAYAPVFYPGVVDPGQATMVTLGPGEERAGVDLSLQLVPTAQIAGTVVGPDGSPAAGMQVSLSPAKAVAGNGTSLRATDAQGRFSFPSVTPGQYQLSIRGGQPRPPAPGMTVFGSPMMAPPPPPPPPPGGASSGLLWALEDLSVDGQDLTDLTLTLRPGMSVSGRATFAGGSSGPDDLSKLRVGLIPVSATGLPGNFAAMPLAANGSFTLTGVTPGRYRFTGSIASPANGRGAAASPASSGSWTLVSAMSNGQDTMDFPFEVAPGQDVNDVVLVFDDRRTELSGAMVDAKGQPALGFTLVVFPTDHALWIANSRRVRQTGEDAHGQFSLQGLPPGEYYLGAVTDLDPNDLSDPAFLESLAAQALRVTLIAGQKTVQNVKLGG